MECSVSISKLKILNDRSVFHDVQTVEHIIACVLSKDESILVQVLKTMLVRHCVVGIGCVKGLMGSQVKDLTGERVEGNKVCDLLLAVLNYIRVDNPISRDKASHYLLIAELLMDVELLEVVCQELMDCL